MALGGVHLRHRPAGPRAGGRDGVRGRGPGRPPRARRENCLPPPAFPVVIEGAAPPAPPGCRGLLRPPLVSLGPLPQEAVPRVPPGGPAGTGSRRRTSASG